MAGYLDLPQIREFQKEKANEAKQELLKKLKVVRKAGERVTIYLPGESFHGCLTGAKIELSVDYDSFAYNELNFMNLDGKPTTRRYFESFNRASYHNFEAIGQELGNGAEELTQRMLVDRLEKLVLDFCDKKNQNQFTILNLRKTGVISVNLLQDLDNKPTSTPLYCSKLGYSPLIA